MNLIFRKTLELRILRMVRLFIFYDFLKFFEININNLFIHHFYNPIFHEKIILVLLIY